MIYLKEFATQAEYDAFVESGQMKRPNVSYIEETMAVEYKKPIQYGVFIQHIDGSLLTKEQWQSEGYSNDLANGVAVVDERASFVISKEFTEYSLWMQYPAQLIPNAFVTEDSSEAEKDYDGYGNTLAALGYVTEGAVLIASEYVFPNGTRGYLPAMGEMLIANQKRAEINTIMVLLGGPNGLIGSTTWSSTQLDKAKAWALASAGNPTTQSKMEQRKVLYFGRLSI